LAEDKGEKMEQSQSKQPIDDVQMKDQEAVSDEGEQNQAKDGGKEIS
jgi:hypothetical protein